MELLLTRTEKAQKALQILETNRHNYSLIRLRKRLVSAQFHWRSFIPSPDETPVQLLGWWIGEQDFQRQIVQDQQENILPLLHSLCEVEYSQIEHRLLKSRFGNCKVNNIFLRTTEQSSESEKLWSFDAAPKGTGGKIRSCIIFWGKVFCMLAPTAQKFKELSIAGVLGHWGSNLPKCWKHLRQGDQHTR